MIMITIISYPPSFMIITSIPVQIVSIITDQTKYIMIITDQTISIVNHDYDLERDVSFQKFLVLKLFHFLDSIGFGIQNIWFYRYRKRIGFGFVQILDMV